MLRYSILGSGSSGNSYYFQNKNSAILIDAGFSCKEILRRITECGFKYEKLQALIITHTHGDHFRGAEVLSRKLNIPVYMHEKHNPGFLFKNPPSDIRQIQENQIFDIGGFSLQPIKTSHDSDHSLSFSIQHEKSVFSIITDTGITSTEMLKAASKSRVLFLEANYDYNMLMEGPYHYQLKQRILSDKGHLSNEDSINFLNSIKKLKRSKLKKVYFCHLSGTNNHPIILKSYVKKNLKWKGEWHICPKGQIVSDKEN